MASRSRQPTAAAKKSTLKPVLTLEGHKSSSPSISYFPDGKQMISRSGDKTTRRWDLETGNEIEEARDVFSTTIHICKTPPGILASIQPAQEVPKTSTPRDLPPADLLDPNATARRVAMHLNSIWQGLRHQGNLPARQHGQSREAADRLKPHTPEPLAYSLPTCDRITEIRLPQRYEPGFQPLPQVLLHSHRGPAPELSGTTTPPVITLPPPPRIPSSAVGSRLPQLPPDSRELLPPSSHTATALPTRNHEPDNHLPEAMLQDLSRYITKDDDYPAARGGFGEIWKCTYFNDGNRSKFVAVKALTVYAADQLGAAKTKKIRRIERELRICANLEHKIFFPFMVIQREGVAPNIVRRFQILRDIRAGLQYLHANSVIHGDFNGPNMYSEVIGASQASWTSTLKGNMRWMAPELLVLSREDGSPTRPSRATSTRLAVLSNKIPYYYLSNDASVVLSIAKSEKPFRSRYPEFLEKYWEFIEQCWSTDPWDRPSTEQADRMIRNEFCSVSRSY
ncbi:kinase-like domain-containing protein [Suillus lakei]|nr:kinase-like domain-containing protein [Suillus lakei]